MKKILFSIFTVLLVSVISIFVLADVEPNGHPSIAQSITIGETYTGTVDYNEENNWHNGLGLHNDKSGDWYKFTPNFSGTVSIFLDITKPAVFPSDYSPVIGCIYSNKLDFSDEYKLNYSISKTWDTVAGLDTPNQYKYRTMTVSKGQTCYIFLYQIDDTSYKDTNGKRYFATYQLIVSEVSCSHVDTKTTIIEEATCTEKGLSEIECTHCHEKWSKNINIKEHALPSEWTVVKQATCTEKGEKEKICLDCSKKFTEVIPMIEHSLPNEWTIVKETSCSENGLKEKICSACEKKFTEEIQKLPHTLPSEWTISRDTTCNKEGKKEKICSVCNEKITESIERLPHTLPDDWTITKEPTCLKEGIKEKICFTCNEAVEESIPKTNEHKASSSWETVTQATCQSKGKRIKTCSVCDITLEQETIEALECKYEKEVIVTKPTELRKGSAKKVCIYCGRSQSNTYYEIPKLVCGEETTKSIKSDATCTEEGVIEYRCDYCNKVVKTEPIARVDHVIPEFLWVISKEATMLEAGEKTGTCIHCDEIVKVTYYYTPPKLTKKEIEENAKSITFSDVKEGKWYVDVVKKSAAAKYMMGVSEKEFDPEGKITLAQAITVATRIYGADKTENVEKFIQASDYPKNTPWYQGYIDYALKYGIIKKSEFSNYDEYATRRQTAKIFAKSMDSLSKEKINKITTIPDVNKNDKYASEIYLLYEAGVLTGSDEKGTFNPDKTITRAESAAIIARLTKISDRYKR